MAEPFEQPPAREAEPALPFDAPPSNVVRAGDRFSLVQVSSSNVSQNSAPEGQRNPTIISFYLRDLAEREEALSQHLQLQLQHSMEMVAQRFRFVGANRSVPFAR